MKQDKTIIILMIILYLLVIISALSFMWRGYQLYGNLTLFRLWALLHSCIGIAIDVVCVFYLLYCHDCHLEITGMFLLSFFLISIGLIVTWYRGLLKLEFLVDALPWILVSRVFYEYSSEYEIPKVFHRITMAAMPIVCLSAVPNIITHLRLLNGAASFTTYYVIAFLPLVFLSGRRRASLSYCVIVVALMAFSQKRSGFITAVIGILLYFFVRSIVEESSQKKRRATLLFIIGILCLIVIGGVVVSSIDLPIIDRLKTIGDDGGSGRTDIWEAVLFSFRNSTVMEKIFGHGFHAVYYRLRPLGLERFAHNSYLEYLYDYGYIGVGLLMCFVVGLIYSTFSMILKKKSYGPIMAYNVVALLMFSLSSYFFEQGSIIIPFCVNWGICLGTFKKEKNMVSVMGYSKPVCKYIRTY